MRAFKCHFFRTHMIRKPSSSTLFVGLGLVLVLVLGLSWSYTLGFMCWVSSLITYAVEIFSAQHFMHVVPIYKSFLFVCLHLFVLNVAGYVAYTLYVPSSQAHMALAPGCSSASYYMLYNMIYFNHYAK